jgi:hypothetical protein
MGLLAEKMLKKKIKQLEDLLDAEMLANERLAEMVAVLKQNAKNHSDVVDYWRNENKKLKEQLDARHRHKDPRITVRSCDDRAEYNRQVMYLNSNPDCESIPPRKWSKKTKECYDCKKKISFCRTIDDTDYCLKCAPQHEINP